MISISIHAPRTGSDAIAAAIAAGDSLISIHAPRTGSDAASASALTRVQQFQSTLPARGATALERADPAAACNFNPRSPHGERPAKSPASTYAKDFNPRSPHGERPTSPAIRKKLS